MPNFKANLLLPTLLPPRCSPLLFPKDGNVILLCLVGNIFGKSDPRHRLRAVEGGKNMGGEKEERGREDLICQEDYKLKLQKVIGMSVGSTVVHRPRRFGQHEM